MVKTKLMWKKNKVYIYIYDERVRFQVPIKFQVGTLKK
jgi:hypothetical protein